MDDPNTKYYYCLKHGTVEPYLGCKAANRLGPYDTKEQASHAMETVEQRNEQWEHDPRFNDDDDEDMDEGPLGGTI